MSVQEKMTAIADAIRDKTGGTSPLTLEQMASAIAGIQTGGSSSGLSVVVDETFTLATNLTAVGDSTNIFQSSAIANQNWYCVIIRKLNPVLEPDTYEGVALYRLQGFNANMIRWNATGYTSAHYNVYLTVTDEGVVSLTCRGSTLPWLTGEYRLTIVG